MKERHLFRGGDEGVAGEVVGGDDEVDLLGGDGLPKDDGVGAGDPPGAGR